MKEKYLAELNEQLQELGASKEDIQDIETCAKAHGFEKQQVKTENNWVAIIFQKHINN